MFLINFLKKKDLLTFSLKIGQLVIRKRENETELGLNDQFYQKMTIFELREPLKFYFSLTGPVMSKPQVQSKSI